MKKIVSVLLSIIIAISMFAVSASAEVEISQAEKFFADFTETKSYGIKYNYRYSNYGLSIDSADVQIKVHENNDGTYSYKYKLSGEFFYPSAGITGLDTVVLITDDKNVAWLPGLAIKIDGVSLTGEKTDVPADLIDLFLKILPSSYDLLEFVSSRNENLSKHGNIRVETMKYSPYKCLEEAIRRGAIIVPEGMDVYSLSEDEVYTYFVTYLSNGEWVKSYIDSTTVDVYIEDGKIYDIIYNKFDNEGNLKYCNSVKDSAGQFGYIYTNIDDNNFKVPVFLFDVTFFIKVFLFLRTIF